MKVYIVWADEYDPFISAIFATREAANAYAKADGGSVEEKEVLEEIPKRAPYYHATLDRDDDPKNIHVSKDWAWEPLTFLGDEKEAILATGGIDLSKGAIDCGNWSAFAATRAQAKRKIIGRLAAITDDERASFAKDDERQRKTLEKYRNQPSGAFELSFAGVPGTNRLEQTNVRPVTYGERWGWDSTPEEAKA